MKKLIVKQINPIFILGITLFLLLSCNTTQVTKDSSEKEMGALQDEAIALVKQVNFNTPSKVKAYISVYNKIPQQAPLRTTGVAYMTTKPNRARVILQEPVFNVTAADILATQKMVTIYMPIQNSVQRLRGNFDELSLRRTSDLSRLMAFTFTGKVPLLPNYTVKSCEKSGEVTTLTLVSGETLSQTVTISKGAITRVVLYNRVKNLKYTVLYSGMFQQDGYYFFKKISASSSITGERTTIYYNKVITNAKFNNSSIFKQQIPGDALYLK